MTDAWPVLDSETEYENPYFAVERETVEQPDGTPNDYYRIDFDAEGGVIAFGRCDRRRSSRTRRTWFRHRRPC